MTPFHFGYHYMLPAGRPALTVMLCSTDEFRGQCARLVESRAQVLTIRDFAEEHNRLVKSDVQAVTLSFDDGTRDHYEYAFPILREFNLPATFYVIACTLQGRLPGTIAFQRVIQEVGASVIEHELLPALLKGTIYLELLDPARFDIGPWYRLEAPDVRRIKTVLNVIMPHYLKEEIVSRLVTEIFGAGSEQRLTNELFLNADELRAMQAAGMEIGNHSDTHPSFMVMSNKEIADELDRSNAILERNDFKIDTLGFPHGSLPSSAREIVSSRFSGAANFKAVEQQAETVDLYNIPRIDQRFFNSMFR